MHLPIGSLTLSTLTLVVVVLSASLLLVLSIFIIAIASIHGELIEALLVLHMLLTHVSLVVILAL